MKLYLNVLLLVTLTVTSSFCLKPIRKVRQFKTIDTLSFKKHSFYNPVSNQTDSTPLITGSQKKIDLNMLKRGLLKWCAVSPDLLKRFGGKYKYGDTIFVNYPIEYRGKWVINDCMNKRYKNKIDFLVYG